MENYKKALYIENLNCIFVRHNYRTENTISGSVVSFLMVFSMYSPHCLLLLFLMLFFLASVNLFHRSLLIHGLFPCFLLFSFSRSIILLYSVLCSVSLFQDSCFCLEREGVETVGFQLTISKMCVGLMVGPLGFEPRTSGSAVQCHNSY